MLEEYEYDGFNQLTSVKIEGVDTAYKYKADGLRLSKTVDGVITQHIWDGKNISVDVTGGTITGKYIRGVNLLSAVDNAGAKKTYMYDAHGDVVRLTDTSGNVTWKYDYDAFGVEREIAGQDAETDNNPFRYCGEYFDKETGSIYLRARYYNPIIGRFTTADMHWNTKNMIYGDEPVKWNERKEDTYDPLGLNTYTYKPDIAAIMQSGNLYAYCMNNPIMYRDESGEIVVTAIVIGALLGAVIGGVIGGKISYDKYGTIKWQYVAGGALLGGVAGALIGWGAGAIIAKFGVAATANGITAGTSGAGFKSFGKIKDFLGSAGKGFQWHHIVEQCQTAKSGFSQYWINNTNNMLRISSTVHAKISSYYSRIHDFTEGMRFRDWLAGKSFEEQYAWGIKVAKECGAVIK